MELSRLKNPPQIPLAPPYRWLKRGEEKTESNNSQLYELVKMLLVIRLQANLKVVNK